MLLWYYTYQVKLRWYQRHWKATDTLKSKVLSAVLPALRTQLAPDCSNSGLSHWAAVPGTPEGLKGCQSCITDIQTGLQGNSSGQHAGWYSAPQKAGQTQLSASLGDGNMLFIYLFFPSKGHFHTLPSTLKVRRGIVKWNCCFWNCDKMSSLSFLVWVGSFMFQLLLHIPGLPWLRSFQKWSLSQPPILWNIQCPKLESLLFFCQWFFARQSSAFCNSDFLNLKLKIFILLKSRIHGEELFPWRSTEGK